MTENENLVFNPLPNSDCFKKKVLKFGEGSDDEFGIYAYRRHALRTYLCYFLIFITGGLAWFFFHWNSDWWIILTAELVPFQNADIVLVKESTTGKTWVEKMEIWQWDIVKSHISHIIFGSRNSSPNAQDVKHNQDFICTFVHKKQRFAIMEEKIYAISGLSGVESKSLTNFTIKDFETLKDRQDVFGQNIIDVEVPSYPKIFLDEIVSPFYVFQICSVILWMIDEYYYYAYSIIIITIVSACSTMLTIRKERKNLRKMVDRNNHCIVECKRDGIWTKLESQNIVPGDVILVPPGGTFIPADCVILTGSAIVNEGMLTGESIPVQKSPIKTSDAPYHPESFKMSTLFAGTEVLQTRSKNGECTALVARTGYETAKGQLVQSILFPKDVNHKLSSDAAQFLMILAGTATIGFIYAVVLQYYNCVHTFLIITKSLDIITIVVPPALPAALSVGLVWAVKRIKKLNIFTISPARINLAGQINICLFDKTGTLTEDGLTFKGYDQLTDEVTGISCERKEDSDILTQCLAVCHSLTRINNEIAGDPLELEMFGHTKWELHEPECGETENFDNLEASYVQSPDGNHRILQLRQFPFTSEDSRASVVVECVAQNGKKSLKTFIKGAPERIQKLCLPDSVPQSFKTALDGYSQKGFRVIALAAKDLTMKKFKVQRAKRDDLEQDAKFIGLIVFQNKVKSVSADVIEELEEAKIKSVMVTGDNILTSIAVSFECGILNKSEKIIIGELSKGNVMWREVNNSTSYESFPIAKLVENNEESFQVAMTGDVFDWLVLNRPTMLDSILVKGRVFARMSPENKALLVDYFEQMEYIACFCGDGANDCGALKRASVGISLSELEASVAAPFTAKCADVSCVSNLIREGRAALMTSFGMFKYMALYSMIQFCSILILYWRKTNLSDWQYLYIDLIIIDIVALTMSLSPAYKRIAETPPPRALVTAPTIFSLFIHVFTCVLFQVFVYLYTINKPWFCSISDNFPPCFDDNNATIPIPNNGTIPIHPIIGTCSQEEQDDEYYFEHYATVSLFLFSQFQYVHMAFVFSVGKPYRQPIWRNIVFICALLTLTLTSIFIVFTDLPFVIDLFGLKKEDPPLQPLPYPWKIEEGWDQDPIRIWILCLAIVNWLVSWALEDWVVQNRRIWKSLATLQKERHKHKRFMIVEKEILNNESWPPKELFKA